MPELTQKPAGKKFVAHQLFEKLREDEVVTPAEIGSAQVEVAKAVANIFFKQEGTALHELALRNPAVLFENMTTAQFNELPRKTQEKITRAGNIAMAILKSQYGEKFDQLLSPGRTSFQEEVGQPIALLQRAVNTGEITRGNQRYIAVLINDLGEAFNESMNVGAGKGWPEMADKNRLNYYAGNAAAGGKFLT